MATLILDPADDWLAVADLAGLSPFPVPPTPGAGRPQFFGGSLRLELPGRPQGAADAALANYQANRGPSDAAWAAKADNEKKERATRGQHRPPQLFPLLEVMKDELNAIRAAQVPPMPPLQTAQLRADLDNKIRNP